MRNWGRGALVGRGACWCVTFFSLCGVLVVKAIQNSPCWRKMRRKWVFRACRESFVPVGLAEAASRESFVPGAAAGLRAGRVLYRHRPRMRYKVLPAWSVCSPSVTKFAQHPESGPKCAFCGVPGEFCTGWACLGRPAPPQPTSRAPAPRESGMSATASCRRRILTPRPQPTRSG